MIASALLAVLLAAPPAPTAKACPLVAPPDSKVSCLGWGEMTCRVRDRHGKLIRSEARKRALFARYGRRARRDERVEHVVPLYCGGCDVPWNLLITSEGQWMEKRRWELELCR